MHAACLKSAAVGPWAGRYTDFSGPRGRLQKSAKNIRKIDFPYKNFPKKAIPLSKFTIFFRAFGAAPMGGGAIPISGFCDSVILGVIDGTTFRGRQNRPKPTQNRLGWAQNRPRPRLRPILGLHQPILCRQRPGFWPWKDFAVDLT